MKGWREAAGAGKSGGRKVAVSWGIRSYVTNVELLKGQMHDTEEVGKVYEK